MPRQLSAARGPWLDEQLNLARYAYIAARYPTLRGTRMRVGAGARIVIGENARISVGRGFRAIRDLTLVAHGGLTIGSGMFCNRGVMLASLDTLTIGNSVRLGERVSIIDHNHVLEPLDDLRARFEDYKTAPITVGDRVLIGANTVVLAGAEIGDDAVIAAGSVVRGRIPPGVVAAGAPATVRRALS